MRKVILNTEIVVDIINKKNKTRVWLAERLGVSPVQLSHWLKNRKNPAPKNREKFMKVLKISCGRLFTIVKE